MKKLFAIFDRIAQEIVGRQMYAVMTFRTNEEAARYFADAINDETSVLHQHPSDYSLIFIGEISPSGNITAKHNAEIVVTGDALIALQDKAPQLVKEA